jgi:AraC-like DNA-binding protein
MPSDGPEAYDRVLERRRAVALARHFGEAEGLSIAQIADRVGRSPATIKAYFYDPTGEKARAVKARYVGVCRGCGAYTQPRNGIPGVRRTRRVFSRMWGVRFRWRLARGPRLTFVRRAGCRVRLMPRGR